jgi:hypothetical protein
VLLAVLDAVAVYAALDSRSTVGALAGALETGDAVDQETHLRAAERADTVMFASDLVYGVGLIATAVVFLVWFHRARVNAGLLGPEEQRRGPGWAVGSWFIPFANLWLPRAVAGDIWDASEHDKRVPRTVLNAWWALWVLSCLANRVAGRLWERAEEVDAIRRAALGLVAGSAVDLVAAVLAVLFVRRLTAMQHAKAALTGHARQPVTALST